MRVRLVQLHFNVFSPIDPHLLFDFSHWNSFSPAHFYNNWIILILIINLKNLVYKYHSLILDFFYDFFLLFRSSTFSVHGSLVKSVYLMLDLFNGLWFLSVFLLLFLPLLLALLFFLLFDFKLDLSLDNCSF